MNRLLALINIVCCSICTGCSSVNIKTLDECPVVIQTETIAWHPLTVCDQKLLNDTLQIPLSLLAENLEIIHFDNREEALMGRTSSSPIRQLYVGLALGRAAGQAV